MNESSVLNGSPPQFLTLKEVAELLRVTPTSIRRWAAEGVIPVIRLRKRKLLFDRLKVLEAVREKESPAD